MGDTVERDAHRSLVLENEIAEKASGPPEWAAGRNR
jgi:hypothetical protein